MILRGLAAKSGSALARRWLAIAAGLTAVACAARVPPSAPVGLHLATASAEPRAAPARAQDPAAPAARKQPAAAPRTPDAGAVCDLPDTPVKAIRFAPEEFNLYGRGEQILDGVLACEKAGLLRDQPLRVIGYADPRGSAEFNRRLGLARAQAVKRYLIRRGLPPRLLEVESRGERCHLGSGPESWQLDRRVEIHARAVRADEPGAAGVPPGLARDVYQSPAGRTDLCVN